VTEMTTSVSELAAVLNGRQYRSEITPSEEKLAKASGLVVAFGASDDLLELRGAANDEVGAWDGAKIWVSPDGSVSNRKKPDTIVVKASWCPDGFDGSWLIQPIVIFAPFDIMEDDELYCRGAVFALPKATPKAVNRTPAFEAMKAVLEDALVFAIAEAETRGQEDANYPPPLQADHIVTRLRAALKLAEDNDNG